MAYHNIVVIGAAIGTLAASPAASKAGNPPAAMASTRNMGDLPRVRQQTPLPTTQTGRVAESAAGEVGQRQTRDQAPASIEPMARITSRIQNRVQNRIRNRIDRNYDPQANAAEPFAVAEDKSRTAGRPR